MPEAYFISKQIDESLKGKTVSDVKVLQSPHKFAWFEGDPMNYPDLLNGKSISGAHSVGGMVEIELDGVSIILGDGVNIRYHEDSGKLPKKHQLLLQFSDQTYLCFNLQMYGGIICCPTGSYENEYYEAARDKTSPLTDGFTAEYFSGIYDEEKMGKLSAKAFLATEQRIPGLGNGVLQDILFNARIHPKKKMKDLKEVDFDNLYQSVKETIRTISEKGGRNTEKDLFGQECGYKCLLSKNTVGEPCPRCGTTIEKASYMGGSVYFCPECQPI